MDCPSCSKSSSTDIDFPELPSILPFAESQSSTEDSFPKYRHERPTECSICGKSANGYHYDVPSCNGCKTFFRRLCISERSFVCKAKGDCFDLTKRENPIKCRACRYNKCISAGMNPLAMKVDEQEAKAGNFKKLTKRVKPEEDEEEDDETPLNEVEVPNKQMIKVIQSAEHRMQKMVDMLVYLEMKVEKLRSSSYNPHWRTWTGLKGFLESENKINLADKSGPMPGWPLKTPSCPPKGPNFSSLNKGPSYNPNRKSWLIYDLMTTVEYAKTFMFFSRLDLNDRFVLVRHVALAIMNLHISYYTVSQKYDTIIHPDGSLAPMKKGMVYAETPMSIFPLIRCDVQSTEYILLKALCLCNPAITGLSQYAQEILSDARQEYADALLDHCLRTRRDGPTQYAELIGMIDLLERQQRMQKDMHLLHMAQFVKLIPVADKMLLVEDIFDD